MLGPRIKERRTSLGLAPEDLAAQLGIPLPTLLSWEAGHLAPSQREWSTVTSWLNRWAKFPSGAFVEFVAKEGDGRAIGKCIEVKSDGVDVEVFRSTAPSETETVRVTDDALTRISLPEQIQVYRRTAEGYEHCYVESDSDPRGIELRLSDDSVTTVLRDDVFVRVPQQSDNATSLLAARATTSARFRGPRSAFTGHVLSQRAAYKGLTALATSRIEILPHQVAAARRVLSDPIQRYLFADEVGLGKTVEAGILVAQHLIDEGDRAIVLVIVPDELLAQWCAELNLSFGLSPSEVRLSVKPYSFLDEDNSPNGISPTLVVFDEAHRTAVWAYPPQPPTHRGNLLLRRYKRLERLTSACPRLVLISGTPVLNHEEGFLAMLHLLDPVAYPIDDLPGFTRRIQARPEVAATLAQLTPVFNIDFLNEALDALDAKVTDDAVLAEQISGLRDGLGGPADVAAENIERLHSYLVERYRLDHRIVRTHRESRVVGDALPRRRGLVELDVAPPTGEDIGTIRSLAAECLEEWRCGAGALTHPSQEVVDVFGAFLRALFLHPMTFHAALELRSIRLRQRRTPELFSGERALLARLVAAIHAKSLACPDERIAALVRHLQAPSFAQRRVVVFAADMLSVEAIASRLLDHEKLTHRLLRFRMNDATVIERFSQSTNGILLCDATADEGLNLQRYSAAIFFFDRPFDIQRIEQRIGRFDRLGGVKDLEFHSFAADGRYEPSWNAFLTSSVRIFERSVARLQYLLADDIKELLKDILANGPEEAFDKITKDFRLPHKQVDARSRAQEREESLDVTAWRDGELSEHCDASLDARSDAARHGARAIDGWLGVLQFGIQQAGDGTRSFVLRKGSSSADTLVPFVETRHALARNLRPNETASRVAFGPFSSDTTSSPTAIPVLGIGRRFYDYWYGSMVRDDRGRASAIWRLSPGVEGVHLYLRFEVVVDASRQTPCDQAVGQVLPSTVRRRAENAFPAEVFVRWINYDGVSVTDADTLALLKQTYDPKRDRDVQGEAWSTVDERFSLGDWAVCIEALSRAVTDSIRQDAELTERCTAALRRIEKVQRQTVHTLQSRVAHANEHERKGLLMAIRTEVSLAVDLLGRVSDPLIRVDNVEAVFLSGTRLA